MKDLGTLFNQIQAVREARNQFLRLWRKHILHQLVMAPAISSSGLDKLLADISQGSAGGTIAVNRTHRLYLDAQYDDEG